MACNHFTFITLNVQCLRNNCNRQTLISWLGCAKADIVALQETHSTSDKEFKDWVKQETQDNNNKQNYLVESSPGSARISGVAILYKPDFSIQQIKRDDEGRFLHLTFSNAELTSSFQVMTIYGPNQKRLGDNFFASLFSVINPELPLVLCGDFNVVPDPHMDRYGCNVDSLWAYTWPVTLSTLLEHLDLIDIWRDKHPAQRSYTWCRANGSQASRLDMFWISSFFNEDVLEADIYPFFRSDHSLCFSN